MTVVEMKVGYSEKIRGWQEAFHLVIRRFNDVILESGATFRQ